MTIKVGLIGISGYSSVHFSHLEPLAKKGVIELVCVVVINPEQVPEQLLKLKEMGVDIGTDVYTIPYAVKSLLKYKQAKEAEKNA